MPYPSDLEKLISYYQNLQDNPKDLQEILSKFNQKLL